MFKNLLNFIVCLALAVLLSVYVSGIGGLFIIILLCLAFIFSVILMIVSKKTVNVEVALSTSISSKGEKMEMEIHISKTTILPTSFIQLSLVMTPNVSTQHMKQFKFISARRFGDVITIPLTTELCGAATVGIGEIKILDYMGIVSTELDVKDKEKLSEVVRIMPELRDTGMQAEIIKATSENFSYNDDEEEESNESAIGLTGVAGYEHRKYEVGDPLKRVNWKLSSKKDELMVRLDDKVVTATQDIVLDYPVNPTADRAYYENVDKIIEASLAMLSMLLRMGYESNYTYFENGTWQTVEVTDEGGLISLQEALAGIRPAPLASRNEIIENSDDHVICFCTCLLNMHGELSTYSLSKGCSLAVPEKSGIGKICPNVWKINDEFEFIRM